MEYSFNPGDHISGELYKEVFFNGRKFKVELSDGETFWGVIFDHKSLASFIDYKPGNEFLFMACNNTFNGQRCGIVYKASLDDHCFVNIYRMVEAQDDKTNK